MSDGNIEALRG